MSKEAAKRVISNKISALIEGWGIADNSKSDFLEYFLQTQSSGSNVKKTFKDNSLITLQNWYDNPTTIGSDCNGIDIFELQSMVLEAIRENVRKLSAPKSTLTDLTDTKSLTIERVHYQRWNSPDPTSLKPAYTFRLTVVSQLYGDVTCLLAKLSRNQFVSSNDSKANASERLYLKVNNQLVLLDTYAHEVKSNGSSIFFQPPNAAIMMVNLKNSDSTTYITEYLEIIKKMSPENCHFLIGVKWDKCDTDVFSSAELSKLAKKHNLRLLDTICLNSEKNTDDILEIIVKQLLINKAQQEAETKRKQEEDRREMEKRNAEASNGGLCIMI